MKSDAIYHRIQSTYAYAFDDKILYIRLKNDWDDIKSVELIGNDPYDWQPDGGRISLDAKKVVDV